MKRRICMIGPDPKVMGGVAAVVAGYLNSSLARDNDLKYISSHKDGSKLKKLMVAAWAYLRFIWMCIFTKPDIIHIHSSFGASFYRKIIFIIIGKWFSIPIVNHIHGSEFDKFYTNAAERKKIVVATNYLKCDVIIVLSKEWKNKLEQAIRSINVSIVENFGVIPHNIAAVENRKNTVLFLGHIEAGKGIYDIPEIVKKVIEDIPDVKFVLCGNGEVDKLKRIVKKNNMDNYIELTGWINNQQKDELLNSSRICFLPSYSEALPMAILEGMAYGLPVISTNVGGIPTVVAEDINGYLYEPGSIVDFANAIIKLLNDPYLWKKMHKNNIRKISNKFCIESNVKKVSAIYHNIEKRNGNGENQHRRFAGRQSRYSGSMQNNN